jgi:hypothetical protein
LPRPRLAPAEPSRKIGITIKRGGAFN